MAALSAAEIAAAATQAGIIASCPLASSRIKELEELCIKTGDFTHFASMLRTSLGSVDVLSRSFILAAALPELDLGGSAVAEGSPENDVDDEMDGRRGGEKRARLTSPQSRVASVTAPANLERHRAAEAGAPPVAAAAGVTAAAGSMEDSDDEIPPLLPRVVARTSEPPAPPVALLPGGPSVVGGAASTVPLSAPEGFAGGSPAPRGFGRSVRPGGATTPALSGLPMGSPSSPFAGLPRCDIDIAEVFSVFTVVTEVASREPRVALALQEALSSVCGQLQGMAARLTEQPRDIPRLRAFIVIAACPALEDPAFHDSVVARLCKAFGALRKRNQEVLSHWFATVGGGEDTLLHLDDPLAFMLEVRGTTCPGIRLAPWESLAILSSLVILLDCRVVTHKVQAPP